MTSSAYVFIEGLDDEPVICGKFELNSRDRIGRFVYGRSYLQRAEAESQCRKIAPGAGLRHNAGSANCGVYLTGV